VPPGPDNPASANCNPPITQTFQFIGRPGDCFHVVGVNQSGYRCTSIGSASVSFYLTAMNIGSNVFDIVIKDGQTGLARVEQITLFVHGCAPDPTFIGGDPFGTSIPATYATPVDAFSPGVAGSAKPIYSRSYTVDADQAEVFLTVRDSNGNVVYQPATGAVQSSGTYALTWDGRNAGGVLQPEGLYSCSIAQRSVTDGLQTRAWEGRVAIDNTPPQVSLSGAKMHANDPMALDIVGQVSDAHFQRYELERAVSASGPFTPLATFAKLPVDDVLATINPDILDDTTHYLRLTGLDTAGLQTRVTQPLHMNRQAVPQNGVRVMVGSLAQSVVNAGAGTRPIDNPETFVEDALPATSSGTGSSFNWNFVTGPVFSGAYSHTDLFADNYVGPRLHYFIHANPGRTMAPGENLVQYVYIDPNYPPSQILLSYYTDQGNGEHRVYWGDNQIPTGGVSETASLYKAGAMPPAGQWVRLKIPASALNLEGKTIKGVVYGAYSGRAYWDKTTTSTNGLDSQKTIAATLPPIGGGESTSSSLAYTLPRSANLRIDVRRQSSDTLVKTVWTGVQSSGTYSIHWDQTDDLNQPQPDGDYYFHFASPSGAIDSEAIVLAGTSTFVAGFAATVTDADQNVYSLNSALGEISKRTALGFHLTTFGRGLLSNPTGLALDASGDLHVQTSSGTLRFDVGRHNFTNKTISANIRIPWDRALVRATVPIIGEATARGFESYKVELGETWSPRVWRLLSQSPATVIDNFVFPSGFETVYGNLATWETGLVSGEEYPSQDLFHPPTDTAYRGRWTIRLTVYTQDGKSRSVERRVIIGRVVNNATGGVIVSDDGRVRITVPPLALPEDWSIFGLIQATTTAPAFMPPLPQGLVPVGPLYEWMSGGYAFKRPVTFDIQGSTQPQVGLYAYDFDLSQWLPVSSSVNRIPNKGGFYALFRDTQPPSGPWVNPIPSPSPRSDVLVSGLSEGLAQVRIRLESVDTSTTIWRGPFNADSSGAFSGTLIFPATGTYRVSAQATDRFGNTGPFSALQTVSVMQLTTVGTSPVIPGPSAPAAPTVYSPTHPSAFQDTFETGLGQWETYSQGFGAEVALDSTTAATGVSSVRLRQRAMNGDFSASMRGRAFDVRATPIMGFDYRFSPSTTTQLAPRFSLYFRRNGVLHEVNATDIGETKNLPPTFRTIGRITPHLAGYEFYEGRLGLSESVRRTSDWNHVEFNLLALFQQAYPGDTEFRVDQVFMGDWNTGGFYGMSPGLTPPGETLYLDNVRIRSAASSNTNPVLVWGGDASATGYSYVLDRSSGTVPPEVNLGSATTASYAALPAGRWYFHVRAVNSAGVWGPANHYELEIDNAAPMLSQPTPPATLPLTRTDALTASIRVTDDSDMDPYSLRFAVNGSTYDYRSAGVSYDVSGSTLTFKLQALTPPPLIRDGDVVTLSITHLSDLGGNAISEPFTWSWQADFSASAGGDFSPITLNGGKDPAWSPDGQRLALSSNRNGTDDLFVITPREDGVLFESAQHMTRITTAAGNETQPTWSSDGSHIAYVSEVNGHKTLALIRSDGSGVPVALTDSPADDTNPFWSADGGTLYFSRSLPGVGHLWSIQVDMDSWTVGQARALNVEAVGFNLESAVSPDGASLVYRRSLYVDNIYRSNAAGTNATALTTTGKDTEPSWSPDGRRIVFASARQTAASQLWMMDADGANQRLLLDNQNTWPETQPSWSPDGGRIAFTTPRSGGTNVWMLSVLQINQFYSDSDIFSPGGVRASARKTMTFRYQLSASSANVSLEMVNSAGVVVKTLLSRVPASSGLRAVVWDGRLDSGAIADDGRYTARMTLTGPAAPDPIIRQIPLIVDSRVPVVRLIGDGHYASGQYFNPSTVFDLEASEDNGIQEVDLAVDATTQFHVYGGTFSLPAGQHLLAFRALDRAGNLSEPVLYPVSVDDASPISSMTYRGGVATRLSSSVYVSAETAFEITGVDSSSAMVVSGIHRIDALRDTNDYGTNTATLVVPAFGHREGLHTLRFWTTDRGGNREEAQSVSLFVDATPPTVSTTAQPALFSNGNRLYASTGTVLGFVVQDVLSAGDASGADEVMLSINNRSYTRAPSSFTLPAEGDYQLNYYALDRVGNASVTQQLAVRVDNTPPTAVLLVSSPIFVSSGTRFAAENTVFSLTTRSGSSPADFFEVDIDSTGFQLRAADAPFTIAQEGIHSIAFRAVRGGLPEDSDRYDLIVDTSAPVTTLTISAGSHDFIRPDSVLTLTAADALSGVSHTAYVLNGTTFPYTGSFTFQQKHGLVAGTHVFAWLSRDAVGHEEAVQTRRLTLDGAGPAVSLQMQGGKQFSEGGRLFASGDTVYVLSGSDSVSGIAQVWIDSGTGAGFQVSAGSFTYPQQGRKQGRYYAVDAVGHTSSIGFFDVFVDTAPPVATITTTEPVTVIGSVTYATSSTGFDVSVALDNLSGYLRTDMMADAVPVTQTPHYFLSPGLHTLTAHAFDQVGNATTPPLTWSVFIGTPTQPVVDSTSPVTQIVFSPEPYVNASTQTFVSTMTWVSFAATDDASGVAFTRYRVDPSSSGAAYRLYAGSFTLKQGIRTIDYYSEDRVGRRETSKRIQARVDGMAPVPTFRVNTPQRAVDDTLWISAATSLTFSAVDPSSQSVTSGVLATYVQIDTAPWQAYGAAMRLDGEGQHTIRWYAADRAGNVSSTSARTLFVDSLLPVSTLTLTGAAYYTSPTVVYATTSTWIAINAHDEGSGVASTFYRVDPSSSGAPYIRYAGSFTLTAGNRIVDYYSEDVAGRRESSKRIQIRVDDAAPVATLRVNNPQRVVGDNIWITSNTPLTFTTVDTSSPSASAGVLGTYVQIDSAPWQSYTTAIRLSGEGAHTLRWYAVDRVGNVSSTSLRMLYVDSILPVSTITLTGAAYYTSPTLVYATSTTMIGIQASDTGSDVQSTFYRVDASSGGTPYTLYAGAFALPPGIHTLDYFSEDVAGRRESSKRIQIRVDNGAPVSVLSIGQPKFLQPDGSLLITSTTPITLSAQDVTVDAVRAGVGSLWVSVDEATPTLVTGTFRLNDVADGLRFLHYYAVDLVGNVEVRRSSSVWVDATAPTAQLLSPSSDPAAPVQTLARGQIPISGLAQDAALKSWSLDYASGLSATTGWRVIRSSTVPVPSGTFAVWNTNSLNGYYTLRLTVTDRVGQTSVATARILVGTPPSVPGSRPLENIAGALTADPAFVLQDVFVYPNPARGGAVPVFHIEAGQADRVTVTIYNLAGQRVSELVNEQAPMVVDSGDGPRYAHELPWNGPIASGVYLYRVDAEKAGTHLHRNGKMAVVR